MNEEIEENVVKLPPFKHFIMTVGEIPSSYVETMSYYEMLVWFTNYLGNTVIPAINNNAEAVEEVQNIVMEFQDYMNNYFDNLDVQDEINNKLDSMAESGELGEIMETYINPLLQAFKSEVDEDIEEQNDRITAQNTNIEAFKTNINATLNSMNYKIDQAYSNTPIVVGNTSQMTDTTKIYVLSTDGKWYYYNGSSFVVGGTYQSSAIGLNSIVPENIEIETLRAFLHNKEVNMFNKNTIKTGGFYNRGSWVTNADFSSSDYIPVISNICTLQNCSSQSFYDGTLTYLGETWSSSAVYTTVAINTTTTDLDDVSVIYNGSYHPQATYLETIDNPLLMDRDVLATIYKDKIVNFLDPNEYKTGGFYNHNNNGTWVSNSQFATTGLIPVINGNIYSTGAHHLCFYDKDLNFVGGTYSSDAYYVREAINIEHSTVANTVFCFGGTPSSTLDFMETESINPVSKLENKTIGLVGDSMVTDGYATWKPIYTDTYNVTFNTPVGGHGGDITVFSQYINTINTNCDFIIVWAGTNDWYHGQDMGSITDTPSTGVNVLASWKYVLEYLTTNLPTKKILAITPSPRWYKVEDTPDTNEYGENINSKGYSLRELSDNIEKLCNLYSIPCLNMMDLAGWNKNNYTTYLADGIHQNSTGGGKVANLITAYLTNLVL